MTPDLRTRAERLHKQIAEWREDDDGGYCHVIDLACEAEECLRDLLAALDAAEHSARSRDGRHILTQEELDVQEIQTLRAQLDAAEQREQALREQVDLDWPQLYKRFWQLKLRHLHQQSRQG